MNDIKAAAWDNMKELMEEIIRKESNPYVISKARDTLSTMNSTLLVHIEGGYMKYHG